MRVHFFAVSRALLAGWFAATAATFTAAALAQDVYPNRPIRIVVPTGAGGITDILARVVGTQLSTRLGQPVVIDNRTGASGIVGTDAVARSHPDGHTLLMVFPSHPVNPSLFAKLPYDTRRDFAGISTVGEVTLVLLSSPDSGFNSVQDIISAARAKPGALNYSSVGAGSLGFLGAEMFASMAQIKLTHIPYKGVPQSLTALIAKEVQITFDTPVTALSQIAAGKLKALAVSTKAPLAALPGVPTIAEALPGYEVTGWNGLLAPAGTPAAVIHRLHTEIAAALNSAEVKTRFAALGVAPMITAPAAFDELIARDIARWGLLLKGANIKPE